MIVGGQVLLEEETKKELMRDDLMMMMGEDEQCNHILHALIGVACPIGWLDGGLLILSTFYNSQLTETSVCDPSV